MMTKREGGEDAMRMDFELCSMLYLVLLLLYSVFRRSGRKPLPRPFLGMAVCVGLSQWIELIAYQMSAANEFGTLGRNTLCGLMLCMMAFFPVLLRGSFVRRHRKQTARDLFRRWLALLPFFFCAMCLVWSIRSHYVFYTDLRRFYAGKFFWIMDANYAFYGVLALVQARGTSSHTPASAASWPPRPQRRRCGRAGGRNPMEGTEQSHLKSHAELLRRRQV